MSEQEKKRIKSIKQRSSNAANAGGMLKYTGNLGWLADYAGSRGYPGLLGCTHEGIKKKRKRARRLKKIEDSEPREL